MPTAPNKPARFLLMVQSMRTAGEPIEGAFSVIVRGQIVRTAAETPPGAENRKKQAKALLGRALTGGSPPFSSSLKTGSS